MTDRITATPDPVKAGGTIKVCYDFDGATSPVKLTLSYISAPAVEITLTAAAPCKTVTVPDAATGIIIVDQSGQSSDHGVTVT
jgi:hypothetical protein